MAGNLAGREWSCPIEAVGWLDLPPTSDPQATDNADCEQRSPQSSLPVRAYRRGPPIKGEPDSFRPKVRVRPRTLPALRPWPGRGPLADRDYGEGGTGRRLVFVMDLHDQSRRIDVDGEPRVPGPVLKRIGDQLTGKQNCSTVSVGSSSRWSRMRSRAAARVVIAMSLAKGTPSLGRQCSMYPNEVNRKPRP